MTEAESAGSDAPKEGVEKEAADAERGKREGIRENVRQGWGFLAALKDAIEDTIAESRERGDLSSDRAGEALRSAIDRAQDAAGEARDRLGFATRREVDDLRAAMDEIRLRLDRLDGGVGVPSTDTGEGQPKSHGPGVPEAPVDPA